MPINFGTAKIQDIKFGNNQISKVYQGNDLVWQNSTTIELRKINNFTEVSETFRESGEHAYVYWRLWAHNQNTILTADYSYSNNFAMISQDAGETWATVPGFTTEGNKWSSSGRSICYGNGIWINVGDSGRCMTSSNGLDWTKQMGLYDASRPINSSNHFNKVIHNGTFFLAVGKNMVARSTDGITWEARKLPLSISLPGHNQDSTTFYDVVWDGQKFVATGSGVDSQAQARKAIAFYSTDGLTWTESNLHTVFSGTQTECRSISWNGSVFVILGKTNTLAKSTDGITWTPTIFGPVSFTMSAKLVNNNNYFIALEGYDMFRISQTADFYWYDAKNDVPFANWNTPYYNGSEFMIFSLAANYAATLHMSTNSADVDTFDNNNLT
jgi:hypothetical protein